MDRKAFEKLVEEAGSESTEGFPVKLGNVAISVEDYPSEELLEQQGLSGEETLFGLYEGVPLTERRYFEQPFYPDRILIFQGPIEDECDSPAEIKEEVKITIVHEI